MRSRRSLRCVCTHIARLARNASGGKACEALPTAIAREEKLAREREQAPSRAPPLSSPFAESKSESLRFQYPSLARPIAA